MAGQLGKVEGSGESFRSLSSLPLPLRTLFPPILCTCPGQHVAIPIARSSPAQPTPHRPDSPIKGKKSSVAFLDAVDTISPLRCSRCVFCLEGRTLKQAGQHGWGGACRFLGLAAGSLSQGPERGLGSCVFSEQPR